jgi:peptidoglycan hydrolase-like protein with peptidoglycan-binding domain
MPTLYPIFYGIRLVTLDVLKATFKPHMHPEAFERHFNFIHHEGGKIGIGSGYRAPGMQPNGAGFAPPGQSFHEGQPFHSGSFYVALDYVVVNPGHPHRAPLWTEVPYQGSKLAIDYGIHMNVGVPKKPGFESWHGQPVELDGYGTWVNAGRPDLDYSYPYVVSDPRPQPPQPPVPPTQPPSKGIIVEFNSRYLKEGAVGTDVKFFQKQFNDIAGQGLLLDGHYGPKMTQSVFNWQRQFNLTQDGELGPKTQQSIIEIALLV